MVLGVFSEYLDKVKANVSQIINHKRELNCKYQACIKQLWQSRFCTGLVCHKNWGCNSEVISLLQVGV